MTRSIFGWSLPPGCTQRHIEEAYGQEDPCPCCGNNLEECICPECPACSDFGNPQCYTEGHESDDVRLRIKLEYNNQQLLGQAKLRLAMLKQQVADEEMAINQLEEIVEAEKHADCIERSPDY